jgi:hypothetical protein
MTTNVGTIDRLLRAAIGIVLLWLAFASGLPAMDATIIGYGAAVIGVVMLLTALFSTCPLYSIFGIRTCRVR